MRSLDKVNTVGLSEPPLRIRDPRVDQRRASDAKLFVPARLDDSRPPTKLPFMVQHVARDRATRQQRRCAASAARAGAPTTCSGEQERFCAGHLRTGWGAASPSICARLVRGAEGASVPREHAGGARVRPASCLPGRGNCRATMALHLISSTVLFARARADDGGPSSASKPTPRRRERRSRSASGHSLTHLGACTHREGGGR